MEHPSHSDISARSVDASERKRGGAGDWDLQAEHWDTGSHHVQVIKPTLVAMRKVHRLLLAVTCAQFLRWHGPSFGFLELSVNSRRQLLLWSGVATVSTSAAAVDSPGPTFRTLRPPPEIPVATAVILLRTTQEAALDWGGPFAKPGLYQTNFNKKRSEGEGAGVGDVNRSTLCCTSKRVVG